MLVLTIARALALKSYVAGAAAASNLYAQLSKYASLEEVQAVLMGHRHELGLPDMQLGTAVGFLALGLLARHASAFIRGRITVRLEVDRPVVSTEPVQDSTQGTDAASGATAAASSPRSSADPLSAGAFQGHTVYVYTPKLWRRSLQTVMELPRANIEGAAANSVITNFRYLHPVTGRQFVKWLFPVKGWKSGDLPYLKTLLYARYFRPEERPPPADVSLIQIEGFGSYRPAQFADPNHPKFLSFPPEQEGKLLEGTPFTVKDGTVWADFKVPRRLTLEEKRTKARNLALYGSATATTHPALAGKAGGGQAQLEGGGAAPPMALSGLDAVAQPASDVFLMADGTRFVPEQWPPLPGTWGEGAAAGGEAQPAPAAAEGASGQVENGPTKA